MTTSRGAFDLSSLSASSPTPESSPASDAAAGTGGAIPFRIDVRQDNVQELVANSRSVPVLIVCTSERSEASVELLKEIEALGRESGGRFQIGRVDADAQPEFLQAFGVRGVPAVVAVIQGQIAPLFEGAPPKNELVMVINQVLEAAAQSSMTGRVSFDEAEAVLSAPAMPPHHQAGVDALEAGDLAKAREEFEAALSENPGDSFASASLARVAMLERLETLDISAVLAGGEALEIGDVPGRMDYADALLGAGYVQECFDCLIATVSATSGDEREQVRQRLVELFDTVGSEDPRVLNARRALASALF
ncbi:MAG: tetratricopeptide repeat protein [Actinomycetaceae bacterium]|nr:tetratricopeptide repeat protein [Actinomycetaceae bacterium]